MWFEFVISFPNTDTQMHPKYEPLNKWENIENKFLEIKDRFLNVHSSVKYRQIKEFPEKKETKFFQSFDKTNQQKQNAISDIFLIKLN